MKNDQILQYSSNAALDRRLNIWHLAIYNALVELCKQSGQQQRFSVSRRKVMRLARIRGAVTYHKYIGELQNLGYIKYTPSYHPKKASTIELLSNAPS